MTLTQLIARVTMLLTYSGSADVVGVALDTTAKTGLVNDGVAGFSWDTEYNVETGTLTTVQNQAEYLITAPYFKYFTDMVYSTDTVIYPHNEEEVRRENPLWLVAAAGQPIYYWMTSPNTIRFYPKPTTGGVTVTYRGIREAPALAGTDSPGCPGVYHEAIALAAAIVQMKAFVTGDEAARMQSIYQRDYDRFVQDYINVLVNDDAMIQRTVRPRLAPRVSLGGYQPVRGR